jgi:hypothetical protein
MEIIKENMLEEELEEDVELMSPRTKRKFLKDQR